MSTTPDHPQDVATSFGSFKPTGHVLVGLPSRTDLQALRSALQAAAWPDDRVSAFEPQEMADQMRALIDNASPLAGFGSELQLMARFRDASERGMHWLLVKAEDSDALAQLTELSRRAGAEIAVSYRTLVVEELI